MNSIEALEIMLKNISALSFVSIKKVKEIYSEHLTAIKQDLDLLQGFKDNHHSMEKRNIELTIENEELKKVNEILINKSISKMFLQITKNVDGYNKAIKEFTHFPTLTQEEYDLLRRHFKNE